MDATAPFYGFNQNFNLNFNINFNFEINGRVYIDVKLESKLRLRLKLKLKLKLFLNQLVYFAGGLEGLGIGAEEGDSLFVALFEGVVAG